MRNWWILGPDQRAGPSCCVRRESARQDTVVSYPRCTGAVFVLRRADSDGIEDPFSSITGWLRLSANHSTLDFSMQQVCMVGVSVWPRACQWMSIQGLTGAIWLGLPLTEGFRCRLLILSPNEVTCAVREISWQGSEEKTFIIRL